MKKMLLDYFRRFTYSKLAYRLFRFKNNNPQIFTDVETETGPRSVNQRGNPYTVIRSLPLTSKRERFSQYQLRSIM